jgi:HEAT repeat protein
MNYCAQLSDFDASVRRFAVKKLIELANPVAIPYLIKVLNDSDVFVKTNAEDALYQIGEKSIPHIVECFVNQNAEVRLRAISVYRKFNTSLNLEKLVPLLTDQDNDVRTLAITRLQKDLTPAASKSLWEVVKSTPDEDKLRDLATELLVPNVVGIATDLIADLISDKLDMYSNKLGCNLLVKIQPEGDESFVDKIGSEIPEMRILALVSTAKYKSSEVLQIAINATKDEDGEVRRTAVKIIGMVGSKEELKLLYELQHTPNSGVWQASKMAIDEIESRF